MSRNIPKALFLMCFWLLAGIFITFYDASIEGFTALERGAPFSFWRTLLITCAVIVASGTPLALFEVLVLSRLLRRRTYGFVLTVKTVLYVACMYIFISIAVLLIDSFDLGLPIFHERVIGMYVVFASTPRLWMAMVFWGITVFLSLFVLQVSEKFGQGVLVNFLLGRYHQPKQEDRIFMFLDLRSSTKIAEQLGHVRYSKLIQDCFFDLTDVLTAHHAEVYQYVGDEVVLTWPVHRGLESDNCIAVYFAYVDAIRSRQDHYTNRYGVVPEFKAGVNGGLVMVAEVGEVKKDLAYHGDVLNTAARIQATCNQVGSPLLISGELLSRLEKSPRYTFDRVGDMTLKGKTETVEVLSVKQV